MSTQVVSYTLNPAWQSYFEKKALGLMTMCVMTYAGTVRQMMENGQPSGRIYWSSRTHRFYQASAPGEPPAIDSRRLVNSIAGSVKDWQNGTAGVTDKKAARYAYALEFGTNRAGRNHQTTIMPRPYWRPALPIASRTVRQQMRGEL